MRGFVVRETASDMLARAMALYADVAALRVEWALVKLARKHNFDPAQPRVPAGNSNGGQWTDVGPVRIGENDRSGGRIASDLAATALVPPKSPPLASVDENIALAESVRPDLTPPFNLLWFYEQVRNKGPWDYKQIGRTYADFGNFNYGATGAALGISEETLLRAAGWAQTQSGNAGSGVSVNRLQTILGTGGTAPYGDDARDQVWIKRGIQYYIARRAH